MIEILFVCLGNICRSPAAEAIMNSYIVKSNLKSKINCDSAGTASYHAGGKADARMRKFAKNRGYEILSRARQINLQDLQKFDYIIAMDEYNFYDIKILAKNDVNKNKIFQLVDFCSDNDLTGVPDPYYGEGEGFSIVLDILEEGCHNLLDKIKKERSL